MTAPWTPDANEQALRVSEAIAAAREDGRRDLVKHARRLLAALAGVDTMDAPVRVIVSLNRARADLATELDRAPAIEPDSPADPETRTT